MGSEASFKWGILERLAVAAFVVGVFGVVASVTLPPAYQEALAHTWWGSFLFVGSLVIIALAVAFFIGDLTLYVARKRGVKLGVILVITGTALIVIGGIVGLIGAFQIDHPQKQVHTRPPNPLAGLTNAQLRQRAVTLARDLRDFDNIYQRRDGQINNTWMATARRITDDNEKNDYLWR
jgi:hypothetical protein